MNWSGWYCWKCNAQNDVKATFCSECGERRAGAKPVSGGSVPNLDRALASGRPATKPPLEEAEILGTLALVAAAAGISSGWAISTWWPDTVEPWLVGVAVFVQVLILGRIYVSLLRADRAHTR